MINKKYLKFTLFLSVFSAFAGDPVEGSSLIWKGKHIALNQNGLITFTTSLPEPRRNKLKDYTKKYKVDYSRPVPQDPNSAILRAGWFLKMPLEEEDDDRKHLELAVVTVEKTTDSKPAFTIVDEENLLQKRYSSCGRLHATFNIDKEGTFFPQGFVGSAAAIGKNVIITAAHNLYSHFSKEVTSISFINFINKEIKEFRVPNELSASCFIHPKWVESIDAGVENGDPRYDVALIFLSENVPVKDADRFSLKLAQTEKDDSIKVAHYPKEGSDKVNSPTGDSVAIAEMIYHTGSTLGGSSGAPILDKDHSIIGVHSRLIPEDDTCNAAVRLREDLLPFFDESIDKFLMDETTRIETAIREKKEKEDKLRAEGKAEMVLSLNSLGVDLNTIIKASNLSKEEVEKIIKENGLAEPADLKQHRKEGE